MNIMIVYGGKSSEHDISVITACLSKGFFSGKIISAYLDKNNCCWLMPNNATPRQHLSYNSKQRISFACGEGGVYVIRGKRAKFVSVDAVVNCCHGVNGEDGCVAALCQMAGVPCVGSPIAASAIAMDKWLTKCLLRSYKLPVLSAVCLYSSQDDGQYLAQTKHLGFPVVVKPCMLGSSIGITMCHDTPQLLSALKLAFQFGPTVMVERALTSFGEYNCAAMRASGSIITSKIACPVSVSEILTFEEKYISSPIAPCRNIPESLQLQISKLTQKIYSRLRFEGVIRVDYLVDSTTNKLYVNEINTIPGSLAYGLWQDAFTPMQYGSALVEQAVSDYRQKCCYTYTFPSVVLSGGHGKKK